ncbi:hypothetical protein [Motilibacter deserti]|uniref:Membrane protein DUF2157 n=1 Tax=Motilibacter deserti TaxID=2714956 RepID=A0ABX0GYH2_9ACTN|nr:hypothetical protein [Motilibacter deserti]NHC14645.1 hypothetical protein [Motilibacter deserti]
MTAGPEAAYRRLLRAYPASWRRRHADAVLGTLLDQADAEGRSAVSVADVRDILGHGLLARLHLLLDVVPGRVRAVAGTAALGSGAGLCLALLLLGEWLPPWAPPSTREAGFGPFLTVGPLLYAAWLLAVAASLLRHPRLARSLLGAATLAAVVLPHVVANAYPYAGVERPSSTALAPLAVLGLLVLAAPPSRPSPAVVAATAIGTVAAVGGPMLPLWLSGGSPFPVRDFFYYAYAHHLAVSAAVLLAAGLLAAVAALVARRPAYAGGALLALLPWAVLLLAVWRRISTQGMSALEPLVVVAGVGAALAVLGGLRALGVRVRL